MCITKKKIINNDQILFYTYLKEITRILMIIITVKLANFVEAKGYANRSKFLIFYEYYDVLTHIIYTTHKITLSAQKF